VIAVRLLTGRLPSVDYADARPMRCAALITSLSYLDRAMTLLSGTTKPLAALVLRMLQPNPDRRPQDFAALIGELEVLAEVHP